MCSKLVHGVLLVVDSARERFKSEKRTSWTCFWYVVDHFPLLYNQFMFMCIGVSINASAPFIIIVIKFDNNLFRIPIKCSLTTSLGILIIRGIN